MKKRAFVWLAALLGTGLVSCVDIKDTQVFYLLFNISVNEQTQCRANADSDITRSRGTMDAWMANSYRLFPAVANFLKPIEQVTNIQGLYGETNNIQMTGATVTYSFPPNLSAGAADALSKTYFTFTSGYVPPDGRAAFTLPIVPPEVGNALRQDPFLKETNGGFEIVAHVRLEGVLGDGTQVDSNVFDFPLTICWGCLYRVTTFNCNDLTGASDLRAPCFIGQDDGVDCRWATILGWDTSWMQP